MILARPRPHRRRRPQAPPAPSRYVPAGRRPDHRPLPPAGVHLVPRQPGHRLRHAARHTRAGLGRRRRDLRRVGRPATASSSSPTPTASAPRTGTSPRPSSPPAIGSCQGAAPRHGRRSASTSGSAGATSTSTRSCCSPPSGSWPAWSPWAATDARPVRGSRCSEARRARDRLGPPGPPGEVPPGSARLLRRPPPGRPPPHQRTCPPAVASRGVGQRARPTAEKESEPRWRRSSPCGSCSRRGSTSGTRPAAGTRR